MHVVGRAINLQLILMCLLLTSATFSWKFYLYSFTSAMLRYSWQARPISRFRLQPHLGSDVEELVEVGLPGGAGEVAITTSCRAFFSSCNFSAFAWYPPMLPRNQGGLVQERAGVCCVGWGRQRRHTNGEDDGSCAGCVEARWNVSAGRLGRLDTPSFLGSMAFRVTPRPMCHKGNGLAGDGGLIGSTKHDVAMGLSCYFSFPQGHLCCCVGTHIPSFILSREFDVCMCKFHVYR
jgi:hypothetical protein